MGYEIAIGSLERGVRTLAKSLEKMGLRTEVHVFKTGRGGTQHYGPSYVELTAEGDDDEEGRGGGWEQIKFVAGGYGDLHERDIGGDEGWKAMSAQGKKRILDSLTMPIRFSHISVSLCGGV